MLVRSITLLVIPLVVCGMGVRSPAQESNAAAKPAAGNEKPEPKPGIDGYQTNGRWREGTRLHQVTGTFATSGERLQFTTSDGKIQILATENLLADRVLRSIQESSDPLAWTIHGTMTEYKGTNFLTLNYAAVLAKKSKLAAKETPSEVNRAN